MSQDRPPTEITILGYTFAVILEDARDFSSAGEIDHNLQQIRIKPNRAPDETRETLLHEVIHGIGHATAVDLAEREVRAFARALYATLKDNPRLVAYLAQAHTSGT